MRKRRRSRAVRVLRGIAMTLVAVPIALAMVAIGALLWARSDSGRARLRRLVLTQARKRIPGLELGRIEGDYTRTITLRDLAVRDPEGRTAVAVDQVALRFNLLALVHKRIDVAALDVVHPRLLSRPGRSGRPNLNELWVPSQKPATQKPLDWTFELQRLRLVDGAADLASDEGPVARASGLELEAHGRLAGSHLEAEVSQFSGHIEQGPRALDLSAKLRAAISADGVDAAIERVAVAGLTPRSAVTLEGSARGPRDRIAIDLAAAIPPRGQVTVKGWVGAPAGGLPSYELTTRVARVDPHALVPKLKAGHVGGTLTVRGQGTPLEPGTHVEVSLQLDPSSVERVPLGQVRVDAATSGTSWQLRGLTARAPGAWVKARGQGTTRHVQVEVDAGLDARQARALPIRGTLPPGLIGVGRFQLRASGPLPPSRVTVEAQGRLSRFALGTSRIGAASLTVHAVDLPRAPRLQARARVDRLALGTIRAQQVNLAADVQLIKRTPRGSVRLDARQVSLDPRSPPGYITFVAKSDGRTATLWADGHNSRHDTLRLFAHGAVGPARVALTIDQLRATTAGETIALRHPAQLRFVAGDRVEVANLALAGQGDLFSGDLALDALYRLNRRAEPQAQAKLSLRNADFAELTQVDADVQARLDLAQARVDLDGRVGPARLPVHLDARVPLVTPKKGAPRLAEHGALSAHLQARNLKLEEIPLPLGLARRGVKTATVDVQGELEGDVATPTARLNLVLSHAQVNDLSDLGAELVLEATPSVTRLQARAAMGQQSFLTAQGQTSWTLGQVLGAPRERQPLPDAPVTLSATLGGLDLRALAGLSNRFERVSGQLTGQVRLGGTLRAPSGQVDLSLTGAQVDALKLGPVEVHVRGDRTSQQADLRIEQLAGGSLTAHVERQGAGLDAPIGARLQAKKLDIGLARPLSPWLREVGGRLDLDLVARGSVQRPNPRGQLTLRDGKLGVVGQPTLGAIQLAVQIQPDRIDITRLQARSGGGTLSAHGQVTLDGIQPRHVSIDAAAADFLLAANGLSGARLNGRFYLRGGMTPAEVQGTLGVPDASLWVPKLETGRKLIKTRRRDEVVFVDREGLAEARKAEQMRVAGHERGVDVQARIDTFFVRGKDMDFAVEGTVHAITAEDGRLALKGAISVRNGHINIQSNRFDIDRAVLTWNGDPDHLDPNLDIRLVHQFPEATVTLQLRGTPKKPKLELTSDPELDPAQMVSLILTGQMAGAPSAGKFDPTAAISSMVLGRIADKLAPQLGVDVIRVGQRQQTDETGNVSGETDTSVEVGKYISERVYLSYVHVFGAGEHQNSNEANVEYRITRRWLLQTAFGDAGVGGLDLFWTYRY
jgi:autotransporter translocation and assembly factor TamB